jgi:hypothetical protein
MSLVSSEEIAIGASKKKLDPKRDKELIEKSKHSKCKCHDLEMVDHLILSGHVLKITLVTVCISLSYLGSQISYGQSEQQNFTAPKFGISMQYPADWAFVPEEEDFSPGIYDYSVVIPPGAAFLGDFCPTASVPTEPNVLDCEKDSPVHLQLSVMKLKEGTTPKEFYDKEIAKMEQTKDLVGRKTIETNKINISGLSGIQTIGTVGGGSLDKLLESSGQDSDTTKSKFMDVYVLNGDTGYRIWANVHDEQDYDTYLPTIQKMIDSVKIE